MTISIGNDKELHPVRFTYKQIEFIKHMVFEVAGDYFEEESGNILDTIRLAECESDDIDCLEED